MVSSALLSTAVMGGVLIVILAVVLRLRNWQHPSPATASPANLTRRANGPLGWSIAFFVVTFGVMGLGVVYAAGEPVAGLDPSVLGTVVLVVLGGVFTAGGLIAVYGAVRSRGLNSAQAAGVSSVVVATLVLLAIVVRLFVGG